MILFQEQINVKDDTLDPAYFAKPPRRTSGSGSGSGTAIDNEALQQIQNKVIILEEKIQQLETIIEALSGTDHREITSSAYETLSNAEKMADVVWFVTEEI